MQFLSELFHFESKGPKKTELIYNEYIKPGMTALVVGPSKSLAYDPSLLYTASLLGSRGNLLICDPQSSERDSQQRHNYTVRGYGNAQNVMRELEEVKKLGMDLPTLKWLGPNSYIQSTGLHSQSINIIVDHGTSPFVAGSLAEPTELRSRDLAKIYPEYQRILKKGGHLLLQVNRRVFDNGKKPLGGELATILKKYFSLSHQRADDNFNIPATKQFIDNLSTAQKQDSNLLREFFINTNYISSINTDHFCPDLYIGKKI